MFDLDRGYKIRVRNMSIVCIEHVQNGKGHMFKTWNGLKFRFRHDEIKKVNKEWHVEPQR